MDPAARPRAIAQRDNVLRRHAIGLAGGVAILLVVHTSGGKYGEEIRIVPARKASSRERALYGSGQ
jgi:uncharacterized DUF497 family protein